MLIAAVAVVGAAYLTGLWVAGLAVAVLIWFWDFLKPEEGPPILALALSYQWLQVSLGLFYTPLTGYQLQAFYDSDWQRMVLVGLGCIVSLAVGLRLGIQVMRRQRLSVASEPAPDDAVTLQMLWLTYGACVLLTGAVQELAWSFPAFTQAILAINFTHLAVLYLLFRRYSRGTIQWRYFVGLTTFEVALGFTGYFADFREPLIMAFIMVTEVFDRRRAGHWAVTAAVVLALAGSSVVWMSVRDEYRADFADELAGATRQDRLARVQSLATTNVTGSESLVASSYALADRFWAIYYPARALERVPNVVAHEQGRLMGAALLHLVTPRALFPDKAPLASDSELVRKYADIRVAGADEGTSIAFGYAAESYVDFGIPLMFLPVFIYGVLAGVSYQLTLILLRHRELAIGVATVIFWLALSPFERSWVKTLGLHITLLVYLGGLTFLLDRYLLGRRAGMPDSESEPLLHVSR